MPRTSKWSDPEFRRKYNNRYRRRHLKKRREQNRLWMRNYRAANRQKAKEFGSSQAS
jgi:hypothetical protein